MKNVSSLNTETPKKREAVVVFKGTIVAILISFISFAILALVMLVSVIPDAIVGIGAVVISLISVFIGAYIAGKIIGEKGWIWGGLCGLIYYVIIYLCALGVIREFNFSPKTLVMLLIGSVCGMLGGVLGINSCNKKRRR